MLMPMPTHWMNICSAFSAHRWNDVGDLASIDSRHRMSRSPDGTKVTFSSVLENQITDDPGGSKGEAKIRRPRYDQ